MVLSMRGLLPGTPNRQLSPHDTKLSYLNTETFDENKINAEKTWIYRLRQMRQRLAKSLLPAASCFAVSNFQGRGFTECQDCSKTYLVPSEFHQCNSKNTDYILFALILSSECFLCLYFAK